MKEKRADNNLYMDWRKKLTKCKQMYLFYDFELTKAFDFNSKIVFLTAVLFIIEHKPSNVLNVSGRIIISPESADPICSYSTI